MYLKDWCGSDRRCRRDFLGCRVAGIVGLHLLEEVTGLIVTTSATILFGKRDRAILENLIEIGPTVGGGGSEGKDAQSFAILFDRSLEVTFGVCLHTFVPEFVGLDGVLLTANDLTFFEVDRFLRVTGLHGERRHHECREGKQSAVGQVCVAFLHNLLFLLWIGGGAEKHFFQKEKLF